MRTTTLNKILAQKPCGLRKGCGVGWDKLLTFLGKTDADDEPLSYLTILESNGVDDCLWAARADDSDDAPQFWRLLACDFAEHIQKDDADPRSLNAIAVARRFANGEASAKELKAAGSAARAALVAPGSAAREAAWEAAWAALVAPRSAAWSAAWAARSAAWAAWAARSAARSAAGAALVAPRSALVAEIKWQTELLRARLQGEV